MVKSGELLCHLRPEHIVNVKNVDQICNGIIESIQHDTAIQFVGVHRTAAYAIKLVSRCCPFAGKIYGLN